MKWLLLILFPLQLFSQRPTPSEPVNSTDVDWWTWVQPKGHYHWIAILDSLSEDLNMDCRFQNRRILTGADSLTSVPFLNFQNKGGDTAEIAEPYHAFPDSTYYIIIYAPTYAPICKPYRLGIYTW